MADAPLVNELKLRFARELLKFPTNPLYVARIVCPNVPYQAEYIAQHWPYDTEVQCMMNTLIAEEGVKATLPTKVDVAREVFNLATDTKAEHKDKLKAFELYARMMGYIERPPEVTVNTGGVTNRVMVVKDHGADGEWEKLAIAQQQRLVASMKGR